MLKNIIFLQKNTYNQPIIIFCITTLYKMNSDESSLDRMTEYINNTEKKIKSDKDLAHDYQVFADWLEKC